MRATLYIGILLFSLSLTAKAQVPVKFQNEMDSLYFRSQTTWITLTPFFFSRKEFSPDKGKTWLKVGLIGQNVKPYVVQDSLGRRNINNYKIARILGISQMWVASPLLLYKHFTYEAKPQSTSEEPEDPLSTQQTQFGEGGYLTAAILVFATGALTYHLLSRNFLYSSLERMGLEPSAADKDNDLYIGLSIEPRSGTPQITIALTF